MNNDLYLRLIPHECMYSLGLIMYYSLFYICHEYKVNKIYFLMSMYITECIEMLEFDYIIACNIAFQFEANISLDFNIYCLRYK